MKLEDPQRCSPTQHREELIIQLAELKQDGGNDSHSPDSIQMFRADV